MDFLSRLRPELTATAVLALPLIGSHLARMAINVIDTVMIGWYGVDPLAALVLATSFFHILMMLGSGYAIGVLGLIASALARSDETEVRRATRMALWLSVIHAALMLPLMWWSGEILVLLGQEPQIAALAQQWLRIMAWALPAVLGGMVLNSYLAALGRAKMVLVIISLGLPINAALNWLLIFGNLGFPELGVHGAGLASMTVNWLQLAALATCAALLPEARPYKLFARIWKPDWLAFRTVLRLGLPIGLTLVAESGMFAGANVLMGWFGAVPLAAHGIAMQLSGLSFMVHLGLSNAATIRVGTAYGARDGDKLRRAGMAAIILSGGFALIPVALFLGMPERLTSLFLDPTHSRSPDIIALAATLMLYAGLFQLVDAMQAIALGLLRGVQDTRAPMWLAIVSYWLVGLPTGWALAFPAGLGPVGLWIGLLIGLTCAALLLMGRFWGQARAWGEAAA